jgi:branched-chain amino acid transport system ATP-binding protein
MTQEVLKISGLQVNYGSIRALKGIDLSVRQGQIVTLIGSNGAGKSTMMNTISGIVRTAGGEVLFEGENILNKPSDYIVKRGIVLAPEGRQIFPRMTVRENLAMGALTVRDKAAVRDELAVVYELFPILKARARQYAGTLSGGEQQMLAVGRAMMRMPRILMLDEPSLGLAPLLIRQIFSMIDKIHQMGTTILLVEQNARMALSVCDYAYVMENGSIAMQGKGSDLLHDPRVSAAYLGGIS